MQDMSLRGFTREMMKRSKAVNNKNSEEKTQGLKTWFNGAMKRHDSWDYESCNVAPFQTKRSDGWNSWKNSNVARKTRK
jgi:hypothetical protein